MRHGEFAQPQMEERSRELKEPCTYEQRGGDGLWLLVTKTVNYEAGEPQADSLSSIHTVVYIARAFLA